MGLLYKLLDGEKPTRAEATWEQNEALERARWATIWLCICASIALVAAGRDEARHPVDFKTFMYALAISLCAKELLLVLLLGLRWATCARILRWLP